MPARSDAGSRPARSTFLRRALLLARPERKTLGLGVFFLVVGSATSLIFPQKIGEIVDLSARKGVGSLGRTAVELLVIALAQALAYGMRAGLFVTSGERVVARLRSALFLKLMEQDIAFFDERRTGELTNRLASDTTVLQNTVSVNISMMLRFAGTIIGGIGFLFYTSVTLTLLMLTVVPAVAIGAVVYGRKLRKLSRDVQDSLAASSEIAEEALAGIRTVRSFTAESSEVRRYDAAVTTSFALARSRAILGAVFTAAVVFAGYASIAGVLWQGGRLAAAGELSTGDLTKFLIYTLMVAVSLGGLSDVWADFMKASGAAERIFELLDRIPAILPGGAELVAMDGRVDFENVFFSYPSRKDVPVLRGINLAVKRGEVLALVGPSGAGKSTVSALLARFYDPDEGRILVDGRDIRELTPDSLRRSIGVVAQEPILFSCSIAENIRYGRAGATDAEVEAAARAANVHEFASRLPEGYRTPVGERGVQLSGGQKQRVAIARAVLKNPRILVLDEATSALDAESEHLVKEALERLMKGRTTLIIAHRLSTVKDADRVSVLDAGQVVESGSHAELMAEDGLYRRLVERQFVAA